MVNRARLLNHYRHVFALETKSLGPNPYLSFVHALVLVFHQVGALSLRLR